VGAVSRAGLAAASELSGTATIATIDTTAKASITSE
jgi:hypothetical protein